MAIFVSAPDPRGAGFALDNLYVGIVYEPGNECKRKILHTRKDLGYPRPYVRDGVPGLPIERQREMLRAAGVDIDSEHTVWVDKLTKAAIKARDPQSLKDRRSLLDPRHEGETIYVASLRVLGWTMSDMARSLLRAARSRTNVHCVDTGMTFSADMPGPALLEALASAEEAHRRGVAQSRQERATTASQRARAKVKERKLAEARPLWRDRDYTATEIGKKVKLSRRTLYDSLGPRWEDEGTTHA